MDFWYMVTVIGAPELWVAVSLFLLGTYFFTGGLKLRRVAWLKGFLEVLIPSIILTLLVVYAVKTAVGLPRSCIPCPADGCNPYCMFDYSFPSGHAATTLAVFMVALLSVGRRRKYVLPLIAFPLIVSASRIILGVHTWLDVVAGTAIGFAMPLLAWYMLKKKMLDFRVLAEAIGISRKKH